MTFTGSKLAAYQREWRRKNPDKAKVIQDRYHRTHTELCYAHAMAARKRRADWINELKSFQGCFICGEDRPWRLVYHHLTPGDKKGSIGDGGRASLAALLAEIERCIVVCSNCHLYIHTDWGRTTVKGVVRDA